MPILPKINKRFLALIEVGLFTCLVHVIIWGSIWVRPPVLVLAVLLIGMCVGSNVYHKDSKERIGFKFKHFYPAVKYLSLIAAPVFIGLMVVAWGKPMKEGWTFWFSILGYPFWGFAQEYALLGFVYNRLEDVFVKGKAWIPLVNGILFSLAHLPNPVLMSCTFLSGVCFTWVFQRHPNLLAVTLFHALFGVLLSFATSDVNGLMSVGPAYLSRMGKWF